MSNSILKKVGNPTFIRDISPKNFNELHDVPTNLVEQDLTGKKQARSR